MNTSGINSPSRRQRRRHSAEFKASVVQACLHPGVSMAAVALANGLNATMLRKWVVQTEGARCRSKSEPPASPGGSLEIASATAGASNVVGPDGARFIALQLPPPAPVAPDIRIELHRSGTTVNVTWPASSAADCATWLRELLR